MTLAGLWLDSPHLNRTALGLAWMSSCQQGPCGLHQLCLSFFEILIEDFIYSAKVLLICEDLWVRQNINRYSDQMN